MLRPSNTLVQEGEKRVVMNKLRAALQWKQAVQKFPSVIPKSATVETLRVAARCLQQADHDGSDEETKDGGCAYCVMRKTDGYHYMLFLTKVNGVPRAYMVNRRMEMYRFAVAAPLHAFQGTVVEGELISYDRGATSVFLIFRLLVLHGVDMAGHRFTARQHVANEVFSKVTKEQITNNTMDTAAWAKFVHAEVEAGRICSQQRHVRFGVKGYHALTDMKTLWASNGKHNDGLILVPDMGHKQLRLYPELKIKKVHTLDFLFRATRMHGKRRVELDILYTSGGSLVNAMDHLLIGGAQTCIVLVSDKKDKRSKPLNRWLQPIHKHPVGKTTEAVVECRVRYSGMTAREKREYNQREAREHQAHVYAGDMSRGKHPREFKKKLEIVFLQVREDKKAPNALKTIVSTVIQSSVLKFDDVCSILGVI